MDLRECSKIFLGIRQVSPLMVAKSAQFVCVDYANFHEVTKQKLRPNL
jgi:hypothetical protein